jgi:myo-inositol 2-dehydrogenase / D-chiro-inositol 1-dehydrogenase
MLFGIRRTRPLESKKTLFMKFQECPMTKRYTTRRDALKTMGIVATSAALPSWFMEGSSSQAAERETSPNERPRVALVGCGGMGTGDAKSAQRFGDIVAVCDVDETHVAQARKNFKRAKGYSDYRQVCDLPGVDVVLNGTPDHWHTLVNLRALRSGKDVYSEKPLTLTIDEGKHVVAAVRETGRILQTGSQQRSDKTFRLACELVRNGRLGKLKRVTCWLPTGLREGPFSEQPVPRGLNWDFWQGQTPAVAYVPQRCHRMFRYWWDYSGGTMTDWGAHHNDIALWGLGRERSGPLSAEGETLIAPIPGGYTAASQYQIKFVYDDGVEHYCKTTSANAWNGAVLGEPKPGEKYHGVHFEGTAGVLFVSRGGTLEASDPAIVEKPLSSDATRLYASDDHMGNFFDCVKSRKPPICEAEIGHRSATVCHLGTIALRLGRKVEWDPVAESFKNDEKASAMLSRDMRKPYTYDA